MGTIRGQVLDSGGHPVAGARVFFLRGPGPLPEIAALSDAQGRFALATSRPGAFSIGVATDAQGSGEAEVVVSVEADLTVRLGR
jgi:uncharacterized GH25 family protein